MDELKLQAASKLHEFLWIFLQTCSIMPPDDELIKRNGSCLEKIEEKFERKLCDLDLDLRIVTVVSEKQL